MSWFRHISSDEEFSQEIRLLLRDLTTDLLARLAKVSVKAFVLFLNFLLTKNEQRFGFIMLLHCGSGFRFQAFTNKCIISVSYA